MALRFQYWLLMGLAGILLVLVIANIVLYQGNVTRQKDVSSRQALIQQTQQVDLPLYREIAQALAELAKRGDTQIGYMLAAQGIQVPAPTQTNVGQPQSASQIPATAPAQSDTAVSDRHGKSKP